MRKLFALLAFGVLGSFSLSATNYYVSAEGNDNNDGSISSPWKTLSKVTSASDADNNGGFIQAGDSVLFRRGDTFLGNLIFKRSGTESNPIVLASYGEGEFPIISGSGNIPGGDYFEAIKILNASHLVLTELWVKNDRRDGSRYSWGSTNSYGVHIVANKWGGVMSNIRVANIKVSDVYGLELPEEFNSLNVTGIRISADANEVGKEIAINDVIVEDCYVTHVGKAGVWSVHKGAKDLSDDAFNRNRNIIVRNNTFFETGGSGVILSNVINALVENNDFDYTGFSDSNEPRLVGRGSGMWVFSCRNVIAQYNRSYSIRGPGDSYGMHIDFGNRNVIFQYNYSEDSAGGFCEILGDNVNSTYRFNVSVNDGFRDFHGYSIWFSGYAGSGKTPIPSQNNYVYNNTIYLDQSSHLPDIHLFAKDSYIYNNLFHVTGGANIGSEGVEIEIEIGSELKVSNNLFYGNIAYDFTKLDNQKITGKDPLLTSPSVASGKVGFNIQESSPSVRAGTTFPEPEFPMAGLGIFKDLTAKAVQDAFGNVVDLASEVPNIGASNAHNQNAILSTSTFDADRSFNLFPNPVKGQINLQFEDNSAERTISITAIGGDMVFETSSLAEDQQLKFRLPQGIKNGMYILRVFEGSKVQSAPFVLYR